MNWPNFNFTCERKRQGDNFYHVCQNSGAVPSLQLQPKSLLLSNWAHWNNRKKKWKDTKSIFQRRFYGRRRCRIVRSLVSGRKGWEYSRASIWIPADVDFAARFPSNRRFFRQNHRISRIFLRGNSISELSATTITKTETNNIGKLKTLKVQRFFGQFCLSL